MSTPKDKQVRFIKKTLARLVTTHGDPRCCQSCTLFVCILWSITHDFTDKVIEPRDTVLLKGSPLRGWFHLQQHEPLMITAFVVGNQGKSTHRATFGTNALIGLYIYSKHCSMSRQTFFMTWRLATLKFRILLTLGIYTAHHLALVTHWMP